MAVSSADRSNEDIELTEPWTSSLLQQLVSPTPQHGRLLTVNDHFSDGHYVLGLCRLLDGFHLGFNTLSDTANEYKPDGIIRFQNAYLRDVILHVFSDGKVDRRHKQESYSQLDLIERLEDRAILVRWLWSIVSKRRRRARKQRKRANRCDQEQPKTLAKQLLRGLQPSSRVRDAMSTKQSSRPYRPSPLATVQ